MSFDFMENSLIDDDARFVNLCQIIEDAIKTVDAGGSKYTDLEVMQAIDFVGFNSVIFNHISLYTLTSCKNIIR